MMKGLCRLCLSCITTISNVPEGGHSDFVIADNPMAHVRYVVRAARGKKESGSMAFKPAFDICATDAGGINIEDS
jgi:hypothetical protein